MLGRLFYRHVGALNAGAADASGCGLKQADAIRTQQFADAPRLALGRSASNKSPTLRAAGHCLALVKLRCFAVSELTRDGQLRLGQQPDNLPLDGTTLRQRLLKQCSLLGRLSQTSTDLAPSKAYIPYLAVGKIPQNGQLALTLALRADGS